MSLAKIAQYDQELEGFNVPVPPKDTLQRGTDAEKMPVMPSTNLAEPLPTFAPEPIEMAEADDGITVDEDPPMADVSGEIVIEVEDEEPIKEDFSFSLPICPGSDENEEPSDLSVDEDVVEMSSDPWSWGEPNNFLPWLSHIVSSVPKHSGRDVSGVERAIGHFEEVLKAFPKAMRADKSGAINIEQAEKARDEVYKGLERLYERLDKLLANKYPRYNKKKTKKSELEGNSLIKEAQKSPRIGGIVVTVPLLISHIARVCINSSVSAGKDIEDTFTKLAKKFDLTNREKAETVQLLNDMGYALRSRIYYGDEKFDSTSTDNLDFIAQYPG